MRYLPLFLYFVAYTVNAAPIATPLDSSPDLTRDQVQQAENEARQQTENVSQTPVSMTSQDLLQQPDLLQNALDTALNQQHIENIRFLLPLYRQLPEQNQDKVLIKYAEAILMREDGKHTDAEKHLRILINQYPDYAPIRLQLALTLSQNGQTREAEQEIKKIQRTPDLPQPVTDYLNKFSHYLKREREWQFDGNAYYIQDNNVGRSPEQRIYGNWYFSEPQSAHGIGYEFSAQKTIPIKGHWATRIQTSTYGKFYWDAHDYDDLITRAETGLVWRNAKQEFSAMPYFEKRWFGTTPYSHTTGGILRYSYILSPQWQAFSAWQSGYKKHEERKYLDGASHAASISLLYRSSPQQFFVFGFGGGRENAKDLSESYTHGNLRASWSRNWGSQQNLTTTLNGSIQQRHYRGSDIFNIRRHDTEYFTRLSLSHKKLTWRGFTPRVNWTWSHIRSNHFYYRYNQNRVFLDISKQFK